MSHHTELGCGVGQRIHFSQSSLILVTGERGRHPPWAGAPWGRQPPGRRPLAGTALGRHPHGQTPAPGRHPQSRCPPTMQTPPARQTPPPGRHPLKTATAAGSTHPSGMHYCSLNFHPKLLPVLYHMLDSTKICVF